MDNFRATTLAILCSLTLAISGCGDDNRHDSNNNPGGSGVPPTAKAAVATAGPLIAGATIALSGAASSNPESQPLTYTWTLLSKPANSTATISPANSDPATAQFLADKDGVYTVHLEVKDPALLSGTTDIDITVDKARWGAATWGTHNFSTP